MQTCPPCDRWAAKSLKSIDIAQDFVAADPVNIATLRCDKRPKLEYRLVGFHTAAQVFAALDDSSPQGDIRVFPPLPKPLTELRKTAVALRKRRGLWHQRGATVFGKLQCRFLFASQKADVFERYAIADQVVVDIEPTFAMKRRLLYPSKFDGQIAPRVDALPKVDVDGKTSCLVQSRCATRSR